MVSSRNLFFYVPPLHGCYYFCLSILCSYDIFFVSNGSACGMRIEEYASSFTRGLEGLCRGLLILGVLCVAESFKMLLRGICEMVIIRFGRSIEESCTITNDKGMGLVMSLCESGI